ncbi:TraR/DksA C4-type zinc finger protein [Pseudomonas gingeri]|uniref:TraR/DksA C4-type zinc finger protein n=1 Tax=Pseudomonas gingeri TaxID=117681 RepID=UPI0015A2E963|nr:TraR/DksA C4-type zinc finger protein [Pseudomonas gingeri]NWE33879.1 TraR/DksA C4-type zinc finger protein [Pseudomonas gingeri]NWE58035.1 TraR/DksA C4-type zinc finger protein [Pseudomonas gingeri]NWF04394.1 TraR/DksA C4-type zinc finger protein [Pseudomonas gingeri]
MADIADFANDLVQESFDRALADRRANAPAIAAHSFLFCEDCDAPIPPARRLVIHGCTHCVSCQTINELREARHAR